MVLRMHQDVIALKPKVVIILAGINDVAENTGPMTLEQTEDNRVWREGYQRNWTWFDPIALRISLGKNRLLPT